MQLTVSRLDPELLNRCSDLLVSRGARPVRRSAPERLEIREGSPGTCPVCKHLRSDHGVEGDCFHPQHCACSYKRPHD